MKITYTFLAALLVLFGAHPVLGQTEKLALYADAGGSDCSITDAAPGIVEVHMIHVGAGGRRSAVGFVAPKPACWTGAVWLGDVISEPFLSIGTTQSTGFEVAYGACLVSPIYIGKMNFFGAGAGQPCCEYPVLKSGVYATVVTVDCDPPPFGVVIAIGAGSVTINENAYCPCDPPLAVEESTWGRVKALYR